MRQLSPNRWLPTPFLINLNRVACWPVAAASYLLVVVAQFTWGRQRVVGSLLVFEVNVIKVRLAARIFTKCRWCEGHIGLLIGSAIPVALPNQILKEPRKLVHPLKRNEYSGLFRKSFEGFRSFSLRSWTSIRWIDMPNLIQFRRVKQG